MPSRTEQVRERIDRQIAEVLSRAHMKETRTGDVVMLCDLLSYYRAELYSLTESLEDRLSDVGFDERLVGAKHDELTGASARPA